MAHAKIAISLNEQLLLRLDQLVQEKSFASRSQAIQEAVKEKLERWGRGRLARECARLDPEFEQQLAEEGLSGDVESWGTDPASLGRGRPLGDVHAPLR